MKELLLLSSFHLKNKYIKKYLEGGGGRLNFLNSLIRVHLTLREQTQETANLYVL